jgi:hypothetical protein
VLRELRGSAYGFLRVLRYLAVSGSVFVAPFTVNLTLHVFRGSGSGDRTQPCYSEATGLPEWRQLPLNTTNSESRAPSPEPDQNEYFTDNSICRASSVGSASRPKSEFTCRPWGSNCAATFTVRVLMPSAL